jgi:putative tryptophan/tyrosine transport system substrate-binding protein
MVLTRGAIAHVDDEDVPLVSEWKWHLQPGPHTGYPVYPFRLCRFEFSVTIIVVLANPTNPNFEAQLRDLQAAARTIGQPILVVTVETEGDIDAAFARLVQQRAGAILVNTDAFLFSRRDQLIALAKRYTVPAIFDRREFAAAGGLMSYGGSVTDAYRLAGVYTGRILNGEKPANLPVQQATKVELIINLKTAKALGVTFPLDLLGRADEVIE